MTTPVSAAFYNPGTNARDNSGPWDIIGDIHGQADKLEALLRQL